MSRTPIPIELIHQPGEVDRNGKRFDYLCRLAEEVAYPVVWQALFREFNETAATGAQLLTEEAKQAVETLAEDAALLENLDQDKVIHDLQRSLSESLPPPGEEECREHTRDFSQILMSSWLETLRKAQAKVQILELSESLLPTEQSAVLKLINLVSKNKLPESITEALGSFAPNEDEILTVLKTLREKLFDEPRLVDLPFDFAMIGAPAIADRPAGVMVMKQELFITLLAEMENQQRQERERQEEELERWWIAAMSANSMMEKDVDQYRASPPPVGLPEFASAPAQKAAANVSVPLRESRYLCFAAIKDLSLRPAKIPSAVRRARAATTT